MPLPPFNSNGELSVGVHAATLVEVMARFGKRSKQRQVVTDRLRRVVQTARSTEKLSRVIIFGSYVTGKENPNDVDVVLIMEDDFEIETCKGEIRQLFDHKESSGAFGASVFWVRPSMLFLETLDEFIPG